MPISATRLPLSNGLRAGLLIALCVALMSALGCANGEIRLGDPFDRELTLEEAQHRYTVLVRWSDFQRSGAVDLGAPELADAHWLVLHDQLSREELIERLAWAVGRDVDDEDWLDSLEETAELSSRAAFARGLEAAGADAKVELTGSFGVAPSVGEIYRRL